MNPQFYWYSQHKTAVDTVARYLSVDVSELLPVLDIKIKQKRLKSMYASGGVPHGNNRKLDITIYNNESHIVYHNDDGRRHRKIQKKAPVSI